MSVLAFAACDGGDDDADGTPTAERTQGGGDGDLGAYKAIAQKFIASSYKATYTLTSEGGDEEALNGTLSWVQDGQARLRFDLVTQLESEETTYTIITTGANNTFCLDDAGELGPVLGVDPGEGVCFNQEAEGNDNPATDVADFFESFLVEDVEVLETSSRTIAGKQGACYKIRSTADGIVTDGCFSEEGHVLYKKSQEGDTTTLEATAVGGGVSNADFEPPYELRAFP